MLSCEEFCFLEEIMQAQLLWLDGVFLLDRKTDKHYVELFALYDFYVEVFFDLKSDDPLYIKAFENYHYLDIYMVQINIEDACERITR